MDRVEHRSFYVRGIILTLRKGSNLPGQFAYAFCLIMTQAVTKALFDVI